MIKKLLDTVPDHLYATVAGIEQFCDVDAMPFEEALGWLKAFDERTRRRSGLRRARGGAVDAHGSVVVGTKTTARRRLQPRRRRQQPPSSNGGKRRDQCYNCGVCIHFHRDCTKPRKAEVAEQALLVDGNVEDDMLL